MMMFVMSLLRPTLVVARPALYATAAAARPAAPSAAANP